ncbi:MAG: helix-turn-helix domain-containing protein [Bacteroidota bacterium]
MSEIVNIIGFTQSLFGVLLFLTKQPRHPSFTFLAIWMMVIAIYMGASLLPFQVVEYFKPGILPLMFLTGPLLYLYVSSLAIEDFKIKVSQLYHLIPFLLISIHRSTINAVPIASASDLAENPNYLYNKIYYSLLMVSVFVYWLLGLKLILEHRKNIPLYFSNYSSKNTLTWLIFVLTLFLFVFIASFASFYIDYILGLGIIRYSTLQLNITIFTFVMVYFGMNQSVIYTFQFGSHSGKEIVSEDQSRVKYLGSTLSESQIEELSKTVIEYLDGNKSYLNPEYNLQMLSDDLEISKHKLSQVINSGQKKNFYKLINEYRIEEVKKKLADRNYKHYSILGIAMECGFNSKTSFNRIFKENTGFTPSEYLQST